MPTTAAPVRARATDTNPLFEERLRAPDSSNAATGLIKADADDDEFDGGFNAEDEELDGEDDDDEAEGEGSFLGFKGTTGAGAGAGVGESTLGAKMPRGRRTLSIR
ncbi:hypothetical protein PanWU01x14_198400 [Parasponia andersonii]|uniref:Uncharacterized protein n=1 Tax=Parasponia andersonii TaxID=3476 RepID=A0A2P5BYS1_PARAD|nr:hypothetical protein PanWU01x14_198400 [Parasponia andersonii]